MSIGLSRRAKRLFGACLLVLAGPAGAVDFPDPAFMAPDADLIKLGHLLFYDPILSGNKTVSCATCHHPRFFTADGVSLGIGDGGVGLGPARGVDAANPPEQRIPRNAPALFNLGAAEFTVFFHDGRLEADIGRPGGIRTPLGAEMEMGFANVLSAQTMFPVLSADEMAGHYTENDVAQAVRQGLLTGDGGAWDILSKRVAAIPAYREGFHRIIGAREIAFTDISDAIAAFVAFEWRADNAPFDQALRGEIDLPKAAQRGMALFYGKEGCSGCHAGRFQTDHAFHAIAMPQIGPGKAARFERHARDEGRMRVTGRAEDAYRFRTPSLRNVTKTAPYGHSGAFATLEGVVRHHLDPVTSLYAYDAGQALFPGFVSDDLRVLSDPEEMARIAGANELAPLDLSDQDIQDLLAFLENLTDPFSLEGALGVPKAVPSGLPVDQ